MEMKPTHSCLLITTVGYNIFPVTFYIPDDHSRVELSDERYINAAFIEGYRPSRSYIATQGPKYNTVNDFWEMVWLQKSTIIVMLCNCVEKGKKKCELYWPTVKSSKNFGNYNVQGKGEENLGGIIKRNFTLKSYEEQRTVVQFHFTSWPDHDIPLTTSGMIRLRNAGAGRTGTFIAVDNLTEEIIETGHVDIVDAVMRMRRNRKDMIQNKNQYIFIHKVLLENLILPGTEKSSTQIPNIIKQSLWKDEVKEEYGYLSALAAQEPQQEEESLYQNFSAPILSDDVNRVRIAKENAMVRVNAHYIEDDRFPSWFVATAAPQQSTVEDFFGIILQTNSKIVVCLETVETDPISFSVRKSGDVISVGKYNVAINNVTEFSIFMMMKASVSIADRKLAAFSVISIHSWSENSSSPRTDGLAEVLIKIKTSMSENEQSMALVYCRDGCCRTGLFLAFANLLEQIKCCGMCDVFRTVKDLREMRKGMMDTLEQFMLLYSMLADYIKEYT